MRAGADSSYYGNVREELITMIRGRGLAVLEVGCGDGATLAAIRRRGIARQVTGIDLHCLIGQAAYAGDIDALITGDVAAVAATLPEGAFDLLICADVLEHLVDPWTTLADLRRCLRPGGQLIASIPNICYVGAVKRIVFDRDFRYEDQGIFDRTHLRFFCKRNIVELFTAGGFVIEKLASTVDGLNRTKWFANRATFGLFYEYLVKQWFVDAIRRD